MYCADVGSIPARRFAWARAEDAVGSISHSSSEIRQLVEMLVCDLTTSKPVALGFECPLSVPIPSNCHELGCHRPGEGNRSWSAGSGAAVLATGLVQTVWILAEVRQRIGSPPPVFLDWSAFQHSGTGLFLWEAFVSSKAKGKSHGDDAKIAVHAFLAALPDMNPPDAICCDGEVYSLIGAALIRSGWSEDIAYLKRPCVVIKATA